MVNYNIAYSKTVYNYFLKIFYNKTNKKQYNLQIWQHNIQYKNRITIKDVIILAKKSRNNEKPLVIENVNKTIIAEIAKVLGVIHFNNKYS